MPCILFHFNDKTESKSCDKFLSEIESRSRVKGAEEGVGNKETNPAKWDVILLIPTQIFDNKNLDSAASKIDHLLTGVLAVVDRIAKSKHTKPYYPTLEQAVFGSCT